MNISKERLNLRSDVVTLPTPEMLESIRTAPMGDDNRQEDPTTNSLEALAAEMLGKEAALLVMSGTMGNLVGMLCQTQPGQEVILEEGAHIFTSEQGGAARIGGLMVTRVKGYMGYPAPEDVEAAIRPTDNVHTPHTGLVCLENTHNRAGGTVMTAAQTKAVADVARRHHIPVHLDGARIFNAAVALGVEARELVQDVDTVTFCLSKGLSCPAGSILAGTRECMARARRIRKLLGGTLRQSAVIAAPGIVALRTMIHRLQEDHDTARRLADGLAKIDALKIDLQSVQTNMVFADTSRLRIDATELNRRLGRYSVEVLVGGPTRIRMVTHRHIRPEHIDYVIEAFREVVKGAA
ncbi:MAG TPA: GntG family PLP-dependent aldolase [Candidatus Methylomirabilis sp.]|nr:GntG family PLP-dependent aldolase [Candidatus Methylomirabilis sp.]HSC70290.1 GntG family PLP-dependent aldolase [Candidatus Methylomirabilis sp.]